MPLRIDRVQIEVKRDQVVEVPWKLAQRLRGKAISENFDSVAQQFAEKGTSAPILLSQAEKRDLLHRRPRVYARNERCRCQCARAAQERAAHGTCGATRLTAGGGSVPSERVKSFRGLCGHDRV